MPSCYSSEHATRTQATYKIFYDKDFQLTPDFVCDEHFIRDIEQAIKVDSHKIRLIKRVD